LFELHSICTTKKVLRFIWKKGARKKETMERKFVGVIHQDEQDEGKYVAACCSCSVLQLQRAAG